MQILGSTVAFLRKVDQKSIFKYKNQYLLSAKNTFLKQQQNVELNIYKKCIYASSIHHRAAAAWSSSLYVQMRFSLQINNTKRSRFPNKKNPLFIIYLNKIIFSIPTDVLLYLMFLD